MQSTPPPEFQPWADGDVMGGAFDGLVGIIGEGTVGLFIGGTIILAYWLGGGRSLASPSVATILLGATMFPILPGSMHGVAWTTAFVGFAAAVFAVLRRYALT